MLTGHSGVLRTFNRQGWCLCPPHETNSRMLWQSKSGAVMAVHLLLRRCHRSTAAASRAKVLSSCRLCHDSMVGATMGNVRKAVVLTDEFSLPAIPPSTACSVYATLLHEKEVRRRRGTWVRESARAAVRPRERETMEGQHIDCVNAQHRVATFTPLRSAKACVGVRWA